MKHLIACMCIAFSLLVSCGSNTPGIENIILRVQYSAATAPWLADMTECANQNNVVLQSELRMASGMDIHAVDVAIRFGENQTTTPAYQIGTDELLVIVNRQNPPGPLNAERVRELFVGQVQNWKEVNGNDAPVQVWVFPAGDDIQQTFQQITLDSSPVSSTARLAITPDEMSQAIANDVNAIGFLPRRSKMGNVSDVYTAGTFPVLVLVPSEPAGATSALIACMQSMQK